MVDRFWRKITGLWYYAQHEWVVTESVPLREPQIGCLSFWTCICSRRAYDECVNIGAHLVKYIHNNLRLMMMWCVNEKNPRQVCQLRSTVSHLILKCKFHLILIVFSIYLNPIHLWTWSAKAKYIHEARGRGHSPFYDRSHYTSDKMFSHSKSFFFYLCETNSQKSVSS